MQIPNVNNLSILGIIFDRKFSFKDHCLALRNKLATSLNIIKYLSTKNSQIHCNTLVNLTKSIILSKIDYGLAVYGKTTKSTLQILNSPYHAALRHSLRAFRTTPVKNLLTEAGCISIESRRDILNSRLFMKICECKYTINI